MPPPAADSAPPVRLLLEQAAGSHVTARRKKSPPAVGVPLLQAARCRLGVSAATETPAGCGTLAPPSSTLVAPVWCHVWTVFPAITTAPQSVEAPGSAAKAATFEPWPQSFVAGAMGTLGPFAASVNVPYDRGPGAEGTHWAMYCPLEPSSEKSCGVNCAAGAV
jgi:hypothetical protein